MGGERERSETLRQGTANGNQQRLSKSDLRQRRTKNGPKTRSDHGEGREPLRTKGRNPIVVPRARRKSNRHNSVNLVQIQGIFQSQGCLVFWHLTELVG